ncbi:MAG TPA: hypothetical protein VLL98_04855 [Rickettsiales bacterium]|nr:hypothetical protein [Rickettsiales bacterium]
MTEISEVQKTIYNCLNGQTSTNFSNLQGIFTYIEKNSDFPYIFISTNKIENLSTFSKNIYSYSIGVNVFDKNTSNSFVVSIAEEIKSIFSDISNFTTNDYEILDIKFKEINISLESNNTIWKSEINFEFIISTTI